MTAGSGNGWPDVIKVPAETKTHDLLCPLYDPHDPPFPDSDCRCGIIRLARDNERGRIAEALDHLGVLGNAGWTIGPRDGARGEDE